MDSSTNVQEASGSTFDVPLFFFLILCFLVWFVLLVPSHELGHFLTAKFFGYHPSISYSYTSFNDQMMAYSPNAQERNIANTRRIWMLSAGPLTTIVMALLGLFVLRCSIHKRHQDTISKKGWVVLSLSFLLLRQPINFVSYVYTLLISQQSSATIDEIKIAQLLHIPEHTILIISSVLSLLVVLFVFITYVPKSKRLEFILAGSIGVTCAHIVWYDLLGRLLLPISK